MLKWISLIKPSDKNTFKIEQKKEIRNIYRKNIFVCRFGCIQVTPIDNIKKAYQVVSFCD